jgi:hypothetical protein
MKKGISILCFTLILCLPMMAQSVLHEMLREHGFEKVVIVDAEDYVRIYFEHRNFRNPVASLEFAYKILNEKTDKFLIFIPLFHNRPMGEYYGKKFFFKELGKEERQLFDQTPGTGYRLNLRLAPDFTAQFGNFENPVANRTNLILDTRIYLGKGLGLHTGVLVPLVNTLDGRDSRPILAPTHLSYFQSFKSRHFFIIHAGSFFSDRYGSEFQYRYSPLQSKFSAGFNVSITGFYLQSWDILQVTALDRKTWIFDVEFALGQSGFNIKGSGGQFLFGDKGWRLDLIKQYGTLDFGIHFSQTELGTGIGLQVAFPIFPGKIFRTQRVELRTTEEFRWQYQYNPDNTFSANYFRTGTPRLDDVLRQYRSSFVRSLIDR